VIKTNLTKPAGCKGYNAIGHVELRKGVFTKGKSFIPKYFPSKGNQGPDGFLNGNEAGNK